jgi:hypothetical protein
MMMATWLKPDSGKTPGRMKEYIIAVIPVDETGQNLTFDFKNAKRLIRCEECIHFGGYYCHNPNWGDGYGSYAPPTKAYDGFCDWAEREEE